MNPRKRTSTQKIQDHLSEHKFISNEQLEYFLLNDFSEAEILRRSRHRNNRSMPDGLQKITYALFTKNVFFRKWKVKRNNKGYHIED
jgi:hypothetical protein